jgi:hypothetical protein
MIKLFPNGSLVVHFTISCGVAVSQGLAYSRDLRLEIRTSIANGVAPCRAPHPSTNQHSRLSFSTGVEALFANARCRAANTKGRDWPFYSMKPPPRRTSRPEPSWICIPTRCASGDTVGRAAISPWLSNQAAGASPFFPPRDQAIVKAIACEAVCCACAT